VQWRGDCVTGKIGVTQTIMLTPKDQRTSGVLTRLISGKIKVKQASKILGLSTRQILRKKKVYLKTGAASVVHGNRGKISPKAVSQDKKDSLINLYQTQYPGWNFSHFHESIGDDWRKMSLSFTSKLLVKAGYVSPKAQKRKLSKPHPPRVRREKAGELIQVDASKFQWLLYLGDDSYYHLHAGIDDATGKVVGAYLSKQETTYGYQQVLRQQVRDYGISEYWYTDYRTVFQSNKHSLSLDEEILGKKIEATKFAKMMEKLGTKIISTSDPRAKGRVERLWQTFQDRLFKELAKKAALGLQEANEFIQDDFLPRYNARFSTPIISSKNAFVEVEKDFDYNKQLALFQEKSLMHSCYIKHQLNYYVILDCPKGNPLLIRSKDRVLLFTFLDGSYWIKHHDTYYPTKPIPISRIKQILATKKASKKKELVVTSKPKFVNRSPWHRTNDNLFKSSQYYHRF
jgi:hypothetical protein